jgi:hypothetical protein
LWFGLTVDAALFEFPTPWTAAIAVASMRGLLV